MRTLTTPLHVARQVLASDKAWLLFVQVDLKDGRKLRIVRNSVHIAANSLKWQAMQMQISLPAEEADGSLGQATLGISNVSRIPMLYLETDNLILGQRLTFWLQHQTSLTTFNAALSWQAVALKATMNAMTAEIVCGHPASAMKMPQGVYDRSTFPQLLPGGGVNLTAP